jgi:hypothetical protein
MALIHAVENCHSGNDESHETFDPRNDAVSSSHVSEPTSSSLCLSVLGNDVAVSDHDVAETHRSTSSNVRRQIQSPLNPFVCSFQTFFFFACVCWGGGGGPAQMRTETN